MSSALMAGLAAILLGGCAILTATPAPEGSDALISVAVVVADSGSSEELSLEIGRLAWTATDGGLAGLSAPDPQPVRLVRVADCEVLAELTADPGTAHVIDVAADGSVTVEARSPEAGEAGTALPRGEATGCA